MPRSFHAWATACPRQPGGINERTGKRDRRATTRRQTSPEKKIEYSPPGTHTGTSGPLRNRSNRASLARSAGTHAGRGRDGRRSRPLSDGSSKASSSTSAPSIVKSSWRRPPSPSGNSLRSIAIPCVSQSMSCATPAMFPSRWRSTKQWNSPSASAARVPGDSSMACSALWSIDCRIRTQNDDRLQHRLSVHGRNARVSSASQWCHVRARPGHASISAA